MVRYCKNCQDYKNFVVINVHVVNDIEYLPVEYTFTHCEECGYPALFVRENYGDGFENDSYYKVYPSNERQLAFPLPDMVKQSYEDAVKCEIAKIWTPTVVMVGRTLEAVCKDSFPDAKSIFDGLKKMRDNGLISQEILEWSDELRFLRNAGAHATQHKITSKDASEALDFLQAILEILYHLRPKFNEMKNRRNEKGEVKMGD